MAIVRRFWWLLLLTFTTCLPVPNLPTYLIYLRVQVPIILLNILNWNWDDLIYKPFKDGIPFIHCWTGEYFELFFFTTLAYFVIDAVWVMVAPQSVKSPMTIIQHHVAVILYLIIPYRCPPFRFLMGVCMSVELNTWFLIARRVFNKQGSPPWTIDLPYLFSVRVKLISICFYISWIAIRCLLYPYVLVVFYKMVGVGIVGEKDKWNLAVGACLQIVFCVMNAKWTLDLANSKMRQWRSKSGVQVSEGL